METLLKEDGISVEEILKQESDGGTEYKEGRRRGRTARRHFHRTKIVSQWKVRIPF